MYCRKDEYNLREKQLKLERDLRNIFYDHVEEEEEFEYIEEPCGPTGDDGGFYTMSKYFCSLFVKQNKPLKCNKRHKDTYINYKLLNSTFLF